MSSGWICFGDVPSINKLAGAARTSEALAECKAEAEFKSMSSVAAAALELVCRKRLVGSSHNSVLPPVGVWAAGAIHLGRNPTLDDVTIEVLHATVRTKAFSFACWQSSD